MILALKILSEGVWGDSVIEWVSSIAILALLGGAAHTVYRLYRHHECHVEAPKNCHRLGHPVQGTALLACRAHHPGLPEEPITARHIDIAHRDANVP